MRATSSLSKNYYLAHVDGLRAIAVIAVLLFHLDLQLFSGGFVGVDVFFVISGFLITRLIVQEKRNTGRFSFIRFYYRRARRLLPALFATFAFTLVFAAVLFSPLQMKMFGAELMTAALSMSNFFYWTQSGYFDSEALSRPLLHTWSLGIEEQFYFIWPALLVAVLSRGACKGPATLIACLSILSFSLCLWFSAAHDIRWIRNSIFFIEHFGSLKNTAFYLLPFRVFEFGLGALLVWCSVEGRVSVLVRSMGFISGIVLVGVSIILFSPDMFFPNALALVPCVGACLVIVFGKDAIGSGWLKTKPVVFIGLISYSLYLVHWPVIVFWHHLTSDFTTIDRISIVLLSFLLAWLSFRLIESRYRVVGGPLNGGGLTRYILVSLLFFAVGMQVWSGDGWAWRIDPPQANRTVSGAAYFHRTHYGGAGYPDFGVIYGSGKPDILLVGDSHVQQYAEGIVSVIARKHEKTASSFFGISCIHLPGFTRKGSDASYDIDCPKHTELALQAANVEDGKKRIVLVAHSWVSQMGRAALLNREGQKFKEHVGIKDIFAGISALVENVEGAQVFVMGELPGTGGLNIYDLINRPGFMASEGRDLDSFAYSTPASKALEFNQAMSKFADQHGGFQFLDPVAALCSQRQCSNFGDDGELVYSDSNHLSKYGSKKVISYFEDALLAAWAEGSTHELKGE